MKQVLFELEQLEMTDEHVTARGHRSGVLIELDEEPEVEDSNDNSQLGKARDAEERPACPDYGGMTTKKLKMMMHANGMKSRPHTVMAERLTKIWHASQLDQAEASEAAAQGQGQNNTIGDEENPSQNDSPSVESLIFQTITNDSILYSHILQHKAVRLPALRKKVLEQNEGAKCSKKDCQAYLDSKGISWTHT